MKYLLQFITISYLLLSSMSSTFAEEWYLETLLDLNYWVEEHNIEISELDYIYFNNDLYNQVYNEVQNIDRVLKNEFINKYRNWEYEYYQVNWIIQNYKNFIYHTNKFFFYLQIEENHSNYKELDTAILRSYRNMRSSYRKVKNIIRRK